MTQTSYSEVADQTIRNFLRAVVLIDDHWCEALSAPVAEIITEDQINLDPQSIPLQSDVDPITPTPSETTPAALTSTTDPAYLREIGAEITNQGLLFTGFAYKDSLSATACKLASKADILILDWYLGTQDSRPALDLLEGLKDSGSPRFIFILTDKELSDVRKQIIERIGEKPEGDDLVFSCGQFSFSLKNKHQVGGPNSIVANQVLNEAIVGIRTRFGGLLQLAALELLGQYRDCLHEVLDYFHSDTDFPFVLEWLEQESPIRDSHSFNALAIDEWTARVTQRFPSDSAQTITDLTVSALLANWKETTRLPDDHMDKFLELGKMADPSFPSDANKGNELLDSLDKWITSKESCKWPGTLKGRDSRKEWPKNTKRDLAMQYLGLRKGVSSPIETLTNLDALFQCQANLPLKLNQGSVLVDEEGTYFICITPTCDCCRPSRINKCYVFLEAKLVDIPKLKDHLEGSVVAVRTKDKGNLLLAVALKPTYTFKIDNPSLENDLHVSVTHGAHTFVLKPVAQLRPSRVQSLISLAAGKAIEVGLDRSELLRILCK